MHAHTKAWAAAIDAFDALVFVTPELTGSMPGVLKNAVDYLHKEWKNKAAQFVSYGGAGGVRAVEQCRAVLPGMKLVGAQVTLSLYTDFENYTVFKPAAAQETGLVAMLDQVVA